MNQTAVDDDNDGVDLIPNHKLCGYLRTLVKVLPPDSVRSIPRYTGCGISIDRCRVAGGDGFGPHFVTEDGVILWPIDHNQNGGDGGGVEGSSGSTVTLSARKKWSKFGMVNGSLSVVRQLHTLLISKCLSIVARVVGFSSRDDGEDRVVVLVDVYLPMTLWIRDSWKFPKSSPTAASLFKHLSCDWEARSLMLASGGGDLEENGSVWDLSDCHVLGCNQKCYIPDASRRKLFEVSEIFKSLPSLTSDDKFNNSKICEADASTESGIWLVPDDILLNILELLLPSDLLRVAGTCHHLRSLSSLIMPCMKLKLFPHQNAAVDWMLMRERHPATWGHPLYREFRSKDGYDFCLNVVSGEIFTDALPSVRDFRGGMFCDEPGLGKTITALSLILKTQGTFADPPEGAEVIWCNHNSDEKGGYYEESSQSVWNNEVSPHNKIVVSNPRRGQFSLNQLNPSQDYGLLDEQLAASGDFSHCSRIESPKMAGIDEYHIRRNIFNCYTDTSPSLSPSPSKPMNSAGKRKRGSGSQNLAAAQADVSHGPSSSGRKRKRMSTGLIELSENWIQCDACGKWRKLLDADAADSTKAWFCSMNVDPSCQSCMIPEAPWNYESIKTFPGFYSKGTPGGKNENISFFTDVLREHVHLMTSQTKKVLTWFVKLSPERLSEMETVGIAHPVSELCLSDRPHAYHKVFQAFGLVKEVGGKLKRTTRWKYPKDIANLIFDLDALKVALCKPFDSVRLYLSKATLIVVPANLVDHWKSQIDKHVSPGQLKYCIWTGQESLSPHHLAWDYDVVITTFSRLSVEWNPKKPSLLMQVHWLRVLLDEGHTLGSSLAMTNKFQMAVLLRASRRWVLTGTPTPNTPNSQISHLQPILKFLHEEAYGLNPKAWEDGILRPFEAEMEEGRLQLLQLLRRCMICARKSDVHSIPPCDKKVTYLEFSGYNAKSYNELVETVRRNILLADWNDANHVESLLNPKQWKFRTATIKNVRLSCCVAGFMRVEVTDQDIQETMDILQEKGLDPASEEYIRIRYIITHGGSCFRCKEWCRLPIITPCMHVLCLDCVALDNERCTFPGCGNLYEMQSPKKRTRPENPNPQWPVPKDLIELQPSYKQDDWNPNWRSTCSTKVSYLVQKLTMLRKTSAKVASLKHQKGIESTVEGANNPLHRTLQNDGCSDGETGLCIRSPEKVIVYSQFLEHIHVIEQQLNLAGIQFAAMYSPMPLSSRITSLATFHNEPECMALLMDGSGALGLDLSFVTHVFLMEPIWDKSMEEQVISRAHRMGAKRPIHVEILAMKGTIEEQMIELLQDPSKYRSMLEKVGNQDGDGQRSHRTLHDFAEYNYLRELGFVRQK